jgi:hypothetical protein
MERKSKDQGPRSMKFKPNKLYKESMKQKVGSLKRLTRSTNS